MAPPRKILLFGLLSAACGGPPSQASTTTGITTVSHTAGSSTTSSSGSSTGSSLESSTSSSGDTAASSSAPGTTTVGEPDLPSFETLGPAKGCGKIDILFAINNGGSIDGSTALMGSTSDALRIRNGTAAFLDAMQEQAAEYDLHVMVVKGDPDWRGYWGYSSCCVPDKPCDDYGPFPCDPNPDYVTDCDYELGAGVRYPVGFMASNQDCGLAGGHRYLSEEQVDFAAGFECILNVGQTGGTQQYLAAMVKAVGPALNAPDGCNAGFLRPDAMLVVVVLADYPDDDSPGTPDGLAASLIAAKKGYTDGIVVVGILGTVQPEPLDDDCGDFPGDRTRKFVEGFPNHALGSFCDPDIGANLVEAIEVIQTACAEFVPPG